MEVKQIEQLMRAMGRTGTTRLVLKRDDVELELERKSSAPAVDIQDYDVINPMKGEFQYHQRATGVIPQTVDRIESLEKQGPQEDTTSYLYITAPMVGTVYHAPSPEDPKFVQVGDRVEKNTVVCIIEAMKVMNEVKAGVSGIVREILVENSHPVEFGTKLFAISAE